MGFPLQVLPAYDLTRHMLVFHVNLGFELKRLRHRLGRPPTIPL